MRLIGLIFPHFYNMVPTTISNTIYLPKHWYTIEKPIRDLILLHEKIHMDLQKEYNTIIYFILLSIFPLFLCPFRLKIEKKAWEITIKEMSLANQDKLLQNTGFQWFISQVELFYTFRSGWMWLNKRKVYDWLSSTLEKETKMYLCLSKDELLVYVLKLIKS
jgi:hypothetical protein